MENSEFSVEKPSQFLGAPEKAVVCLRNHVFGDDLDACDGDDRKSSEEGLEGAGDVRGFVKFCVGNGVRLKDCRVEGEFFFFFLMLVHTRVWRRWDFLFAISFWVHKLRFLMCDSFVVFASWRA